MAEVLMSSPRRINEMQPKPQPGDRCVLVIFGAAGELTKRLLVPAVASENPIQLTRGSAANQNIIAA
jgi:glucose-6-phosphate 1-dehydrogenase